MRHKKKRSRNTDFKARLTNIGLAGDVIDGAIHDGRLGGADGDKNSEDGKQHPTQLKFGGRCYLF